MSIDTLVLIITVLAITVTFGLAFYYDRKEEPYYKRHSMQSVFHCIKCHNIFSHTRKREVARCPNCQFKNIRLKF